MARYFLPISLLPAFFLVACGNLANNETQPSPSPSASTQANTRWAKLLPSDSAANDNFGGSVAISNDASTLCVGAEGKTIGANVSQGAVYVFAKSGENWSELQKLTASDAAANDNFGFRISTISDGSTILISACQKGIGSNSQQGAVYVFIKSGNSWSQTQELTASDGAANDKFGFNIANTSDGNTIIIGAPDKLIGSNSQQGAAYVFTKSGNSWIQAQELTASDGIADDGFGFCVAASGDGSTIIIGTENAGVNNPGIGATYVFTKSGSNWSQVQKLTASDGVKWDRFGHSINASSDGSMIIIGATQKSIGINSSQGAVYVFTKAENTWSQIQELAASDGSAEDYFGSTVVASSDGNTLIVGASTKSVGGNSCQGAAYLFAKSGSTWTQAKEITTENGEAYDYFCDCAAIADDGNTFIIGAGGKNQGQGAAYVFTK